MGKNAIIAVVVVVVVLAGGVVLAMHHGSKDTMNMGSSSTSSTSSSSSSTKATATNSVTIDNFAFSPANITVKVGTKVTWTNQDSVAHTVQETDGQTGPNSSNLDTGKSYSFTYATAGTYKYHCSIHPDMLGTVTVTQ